MIKAIVYSRAIRTGKTSELFDYINNNPGKWGGFLTPQTQETDLRYLFALRKNKYFAFQTKRNTPDTTTVGNFVFLNTAFQKAINVLKFDEKHLNHFVIDEVGKLELEDRGFEPMFSAWLENLKKSKKHFTILFVVRDTLIEEFLSKYINYFKTIQRIHSLAELTNHANS